MHVGQPPVDAVVAEGQLLVVDAQQVQDGGVDVVAVGAASSTALYDHSSLSPYVTPPLMPPPASQLVKVKGLWSRPLLPWLHGIRPNSVVHRTMVSSSKPRCLQVLEKSGRRAVHARAHVAVVAGDVLVRVPVAAREAVVGPAPDLHEAHAALQQPPGDQAIAAEVLRDRGGPGRTASSWPRFPWKDRAPRGAQLQFAANS